MSNPDRDTIDMAHEPFYMTPEDSILIYEGVSMNATQTKLLSMYKDVAYALDSCDIRYYIGYGTAIGAVRHNGFIPWDDDIDILVWEEDLPRIETAFSEKLDPNKYYYHKSKADSHPHVILKEGDFKQSLKNRTAPFIDIFPLVKYPDKKFRKVLSDITVMGMQIMITAIDLINSRLIYKCARWTIPILKKISEMICNDDTKTVTVLTTTFFREICPAKYFSEPIMHTFEDTEAPLPNQYDRLLRDFYGNYMEIPPEEKRTGASGYPCCIYFDYLEDNSQH